jgi:transcriptional regulator with XRE-family HTH domain
MKKNVTLKVIIWSEFPSQRRFCEFAGLNEGVLSEILNGKRNATPEQEKAICNAIGMEIDEIFPDKE